MTSNKHFHYFLHKTDSQDSTGWFTFFLHWLFMIFLVKNGVWRGFWVGSPCLFSALQVVCADIFVPAKSRGRVLNCSFQTSDSPGRHFTFISTPRKVCCCTIQCPWEFEVSCKSFYNHCLFWCTEIMSSVNLWDCSTQLEHPVGKIGF